MTYKRISDMTPTEFERCCLDILSGYAEEEHLNGFEITHNKIIKASDGRYQIDVYAEFTAMGARFKILCECKKYKYRVGREKVAVLHRKLDSIGAQKGILISTSDFQSGALEYAKAHPSNDVGIFPPAVRSRLMTPFIVSEIISSPLYCSQIFLTLCITRLCGTTSQSFGICPTHSIPLSFISRITSP